MCSFSLFSFIFLCPDLHQTGKWHILYISDIILQVICKTLILLGRDYCSTINFFPLLLNALLFPDLSSGHYFPILRSWQQGIITRSSSLGRMVILIWVWGLVQSTNSNKTKTKQNKKTNADAICTVDDAAISIQ